MPRIRCTQLSCLGMLLHHITEVVYCIPNPYLIDFLVS